MQERIVITGVKGNIGTILMEGLASDELEITPIDLPQVDVRNYDQLLKSLQNQDVLIHLAWNSKTENFRNGKIDPDNFTMVKNVYRAALEAGIKRVIMASSIHADKFYDWQMPPLMSTAMSPTPDSPYGQDKIAIENLGKDYATKGLEVVAIRFGGISSINKPPAIDFVPKEERAAWLSKNDCVSLVRSIINAEIVPNNFVLMYAVSNNQNRIHDISNPFGWTPQESADDFS